MDSEPQVFEAEIVDAGPPPPSRDSAGGFLPGHSVGRPRGAKGKLRAGLLAGFQEFLERFPHANPLLVLAAIAIDATIKAETRVAAAGRLANILIPPSARTAEVVNIDLRAVNLMQQASKIPGARAVMERLARSQGQARLLASGKITDSHILKVPIHPGSQAAIESGPVEL